MPKPRLIDSEHFPANLARVMLESGLNDSRVGFLIGVSRQAVHRWRQGTNSPDMDNLASLCVALKCSRATLLDAPPRSVIRYLSINDWARREGIPVSRAKDLFALRILSGEKHTDYTTLVPESLSAPEDSKTLVTMAKVRPRWVPTFHRNFEPLLIRSGLTKKNVGDKVGVNATAVGHWIQGRNYPERERLPLIAEALNTSVQELAGHI